MMSWTLRSGLAAAACASPKTASRVLVWVAMEMTYRHGWPSEIFSEFSTESRGQRLWRGEHMSSIEKTLVGVTVFFSMAGQHFSGLVA